MPLFNGKDLTGWHPSDPKLPAWKVENGTLVSPGRGAELITDAKFQDFKLHVEFNCARGANSGVYLRGRYEVQIASDYGRPPGMHGTGALYTRILPSVNAGKPPGEWQTYDIRLVGREVTTVLNGQKLYEKRVIDGLTGIAFDPFEGRPGPIELQGDHGGVEFRNVVLVPLTKRDANRESMGHAHFLRRGYEVARVDGVWLTGGFPAGASHVRPPASRQPGTSELAHLLGNLCKSSL